MAEAIDISGLALHAYHGVMRREAEAGQTFRMDLVLAIDLTEASRTDKLKNTVPYEQVVSTASAAFCSRHCRLVEAAAGAVATPCLKPFPRFAAFRSRYTKSMLPLPQPLTASASRFDAAPVKRRHRERDVLLDRLNKIIDALRVDFRRGMYT